MAATSRPVGWTALDGFPGHVSWMLLDACHNWVYTERGLEVVREEDPVADLETVVATTIEAYRALATVGTDFGWSTMEDPDTFHRYPGGTGDLSPELIARLEALTEIPSPSTLGFLRNPEPISPDLVQRAMEGLEGLRSG